MIRLLIQNWWLLFLRGVFAIAFAIFIFVFLPLLPMRLSAAVRICRSGRDLCACSLSPPAFSPWQPRCEERAGRLVVARCWPMALP